MRKAKLRPCGRSVLPFEIKKTSLALRTESRLEKTFSMGINCMSLGSRLDQPLIQRLPAGLSSTVACLDINKKIKATFLRYKVGQTENNSFFI